MKGRNLMDDPHSYYYYEEKQRELYRKRSKLIRKINIWLTGEISDFHSNDQDADVDSRELGILEGRYECARSLITQIKKWENGYE